nr:guanine nucleotide-binding protein G(I)/G(S)/G(O) subunit gamma-4 isoform X2 [Panthera onca]
MDWHRGQRMKEGMSNNSNTSISQARKAVEQLKMEACMDRVKVSTPEPASPPAPNPARSGPPISSRELLTRYPAERPAGLGSCNIYK